MPKFHDEFFRSTTSHHDQLIVDTITQLDQVIENLIKKYESQEQVSVTRCIDRKYCGKQDDPLLEYPIKCNECSYCKVSNEGYNTAPPRYQPNSEQVEATKTVKIKDYSTKVETEKIYSNQSSGFIIGYADIVVKIKAKQETTLTTKTVKWSTSQELLFYVIIDAKPRLESWGGPLRQVKTYMRHEKNLHSMPVYGVITTYSNINETHRTIIEQEKVSIITLTRSTGEK